MSRPAANRPVTVCVCTVDRPSLRDTLRSLAAQTAPPRRVVVAQNGAAPTAEATIGPVPGLDVTWLHAPAGNVSVARNACLEEVGDGLLAFIDDDETAPPEWLEALSAALTGELSAVFGPTRAVYGADAPAWMRAGGLHDQAVANSRGALRTGHSGNCLIDLSDPAFAGLRFDPRFGRTGGEDTDFFHRAYARGARYGHAEAAWVAEPVPADRASLAWLMRRKLRAGQSYQASMPDQARYKAFVAVSAAPKVAWCVASAVVARDPARRARRLMRASLHLGMIRQAVGLRPEQHYGRTDDGVGKGW